MQLAFFIHLNYRHLSMSVCWDSISLCIVYVKWSSLLPYQKWGNEHPYTFFFFFAMLGSLQDRSHICLCSAEESGLTQEGSWKRRPRASLWAGAVSDLHLRSRVSQTTPRVWKDSHASLFTEVWFLPAKDWTVTVSLRTDGGILCNHWKEWGVVCASTDQLIAPKPSVSSCGNERCAVK